ncbi:MAG: aminotransferase class V-fold PLP-dependent enzyme [Pseudomonadota bacterium]
MAKDVLDVEFCRRFFPALKNGVAYFENAGGSYVPQQVVDRLQAYMSECQNQPAWAFRSSQDATQRLEGAHRLFAEMIGAERDEIVIGPSTTLNVYILAQGLRPNFAPGDEIIVTNQDHEANGGAWRRLEEFGIVVRQWSIDPVSGLLDLAELDGLLNKKTRLLCFPHVSNVVGSINPVAEIAAKARRVGALTCVDGVAYAAHGLIDVKDWDVDFYLFSLYKIYGPHLALMYGKREAIALCRNQNHYFHENNPPETIHPGGLNYESVAALSGVGDYFDALYEHHFGGEANDPKTRLQAVFRLIEGHEGRCQTRFLDYLRSRADIRIIGDASGDREKRMPTISFSLDDWRSRDLAQGLADKDIAVGHGHFYGHRCVRALGYDDPEDGVVRVSMVHYTSLEEVDQLISAMDELLSS